MKSQYHFWVMGLLAGLIITERVACQEQAAPQRELPLMLGIDWKKGPGLPQGLQDSDGGIVAGTLVSIGGYCSGQEGVPGKPDKYPRGFLRKVWGLDLHDPAAQWQELPEFPGAARQGLDACVVNDRLYCWGGFSYEEPYAYRDGYRLSHGADGWTWNQLPDFPSVILSPGSCAIGTKIYVMGGADYDTQKFYTKTDRTGQVARLGARLYAIDTQALDQGWEALPECPGTPRYVHAVAAVNGIIYVFGGATGSDNAAAGTFTVVDNWRYDPTTREWSRLADLPVASGNFPSGPIVYLNRYILLIGGYQYSRVMNPDGSTRDSYGAVTRHYADNAMCSDVFVFDTEGEAFGRASNLPLNNNLPMAIVRGETLHLIGGEIGAAEIEGETFGHHPELYLIGTFRNVER